MFLIKTKQGYYTPSDTESHEASAKIAPGTEVKATVPRNVGHHRKAFSLLNIGYDNQDKYTSLEVYRKVITIRAGYFDEVEGKDGATYYFPKSLSFESMSQADFQKWYDATVAVISSDMETAPEIIRREVDGFY